MLPREKHIFQMITRRIKELDASADVILYGSHARGQANWDSDWDILVLLNKENVSLKIEQEFRHHLFEIELEIGEPISIFVRSKSQWESKYKITPLYKSVKSEGVSI
jgi:predicted nucleotidyltransferase